MYVFTWDEQKSDANLQLRGFDFGFATRIFDAHALERQDTRREYGELRVRAIGVAEGVCLTVIFTDRIVGERHLRRIISARHSNRRERIAYAEDIQDSRGDWPGPS